MENITDVALPHHRWVRDLFNDSGTGWNHSLIFNTFTLEVARQITSIYISPDEKEDCLRWTPAKDGNYSVKSGYWVAKKLKDGLSSNPSSSSNNSDKWKWFWNLCIPPKWRIFMWRCMRESLPTSSALNHRNIHTPNICIKCGLSAETPEHALRDCMWAKFLWEVSPLRIQGPHCIPLISLHDWICSIIHGKSQEFQEVFVSIMWIIWKARNLAVFQNKVLPHSECLRIAQMTLHDYHAANSETRPRQQAEPPDAESESWPPVGWIKLNTDASFNFDGSVGIGGIFHDHTGEPLHIVAKFLPSCSDVELAEGLACLEGIKVAGNKGIRTLVVELDNKSLESTLNKGIIPRSPLGAVIGDILNAAKACDRVVFRWVGRDKNVTAHQIARLARRPDFNLADMFISFVAQRHNSNHVFAVN